MFPLVARLLALCWIFSPALPLGAQSAKAKSLPEVPTITTRQFAEGTAHVTVTGGIRIDADIPLNIKASYGDGEVTWIQFGASGSAEPNLLVTYGEDRQVGVGIGLGKKTATAESEHCSGEASATAELVTGKYRCTGVTGYDAATGKMSRVDIAVTFTARTAKP